MSDNRLDRERVIVPIKQEYGLSYEELVSIWGEEVVFIAVSGHLKSEIYYSLPSESIMKYARIVVIKVLGGEGYIVLKNRERQNILELLYDVSDYEIYSDFKKGIDINKVADKKLIIDRFILNDRGLKALECLSELMLKNDSKLEG